MNDFLNPYIAGAPVVEPSMFFGRQDVFDWIEQNLSGRFVNHILVIHGQRRVGKTSVLKQIPNHLPSRFIHVFIDLQGRTHTSLDRFQWWLAREISRAVSQACGQSIPIVEREFFANDSEYLASTFLPEVLSKLGESILLLTFDEFDTLTEPEIQQSLTRPLIAYLRRLFDLPNLNFIFSIGSSGHKLENMQASYTEFFKTALYRKISFLKEEDCSRLITCPVEGMLVFEPMAVERIYAITSGHPYFTQLICHELFSLSQKTGRRNITREDVESVLEDVIERGTVNLKFVWDEASDLEKWVLSSLAHELHAQDHDPQALGMQSRQVCNDKQLASVLNNQHVRYSEIDLNAALVHLREKDVLTQENRFVVELLCVWLLKNRPLDRVREELVQVNPIANRYNEIGDEFCELGQPGKALESFRQALSTDPSNLRAQVSIANLHLEAKDFDQAIQGFEAALRIDEDDINARSGLCTAFMALGETAAEGGNFEQAGDYYQRILTINPDQSGVQHRLVVLYTRLADEALAAGDAELALRYYPRALDYAPEDSQLRERYTRAKQQHTQRLIDELLKQSQQAQEKQDWEAALDGIQRAQQLAPDDPALLTLLANVKDTARRQKISNLCTHAQEMEQSERWEEAIQDWEACIKHQPEGEEKVRQSLEHARQMQKIASDYHMAQSAIKDGRYSQAIPLLQGVITMDATYKDAARLLVDCLKARPKQMLKLPVRWLRWTLLILLLIAVIVGLITQWSRVSPLLAGLVQPKTPISTQAAEITLPSTQASSNLPPPTATADTAGQDSASFAQVREEMIGDRAPDIQDDFSSTTLGEYWMIDGGAQNASLQDGVLRLNNQYTIGDDSLKRMNYILQVDLRFSELSGGEKFYYSLRLNPLGENTSTDYTLEIIPSLGTWTLFVITNPNDAKYTQLKQGSLGVIEAGHWYELGVVVQDDYFRVFWDDTEILNQSGVRLYGLNNHFGLDPKYAGVSATLDIDNWRFWNLGISDWMTNEWIIESSPTVVEDTFTGGEGWQFSPPENEKYKDGRVMLNTEGDETGLTRDDLQGYTDIAMEVSFIPQDMPESASLVWFLGKNTTTGDMIAFEYFPSSGQWQISKVENSQWVVLTLGWTYPTPQGSTGTIMVVGNGNQVSAFFGDTFLGYASTDRSGSGTWNELVIRSGESPFAQADISKINFWNLGAPSFTQMRENMVGDTPPSVEDDFSADTLQEYWYWDGSPSGTLQDDALRVEDRVGKPIQLMNYILQVDLRFGSLSGDENFEYVIRDNEIAPQGTGYHFSIHPSMGDWSLSIISNPQEPEIPLQNGVIESIEAGRWYKLGVVVNNDVVWIYWDNMELLTQEDVNLFGLSNSFTFTDDATGDATLDIDNWRSWDLGTPSWMRNDWITESPSTFADDNFTPDEGWEFSQDNEKYEDGKAVLYATGEESILTRDDFHINNFAIEASFSPRDMPDTATLGWILRKRIPIDNRLNFAYNSTNGYWEITEQENQQARILTSGWTQPTSQGSIVWISVVMDGDRVSAFLGDTFLGYAESSLAEPGTRNELVIWSAEGENAQVDISSIKFWDLDAPEMMIPERIYLRTPTYTDNYFESNEGWVFDPAENEKYEDGRAVLFTDGIRGTSLEREELNGTDIAMEVTFIPRDMTDPASLEWQLRADTIYNNSYFFKFTPETGGWLIAKHENEGWSYIANGSTQPVPQDTMATIMVVADADQIKVFLNQVLIDTVYIDLSGVGTMYPILVLLRNGPGFAQVDISNINFWNLDG